MRRFTFNWSPPSNDPAASPTPRNSESGLFFGMQSQRQVTGPRYTPKTVRQRNLRDVPASIAHHLHAPAIVRRLKVLDATFTPDGFLRIKTDYLVLAIEQSRTMRFGPETIAAVLYFQRVIERGDLIDAVVLPRAEDGSHPIEAFWIDVRYVGASPSDGWGTMKEDGQFAMRAKAGEKAERVVTRMLRDVHGHTFEEGACETPGYFEIRSKDKRIRRPDRVCSCCGMTVEVKKRNHDTQFVVSHSDRRPFSTENASNGIHAFVFADMQPRFVSNTDIARALSLGRFQNGQGSHDRWAEIDQNAVRVIEAPRCAGAMRQAA
ncbi:TPA: hypothetical protein QDB07_000859 [Burkholderia vietnamiensis]|nr:hypothetical protein [Burkholderia vietnamiensis]